MTLDDSAVAIELARRLRDAGWTQYRLVKEAGFADSTARRLLGIAGEPSLAAAEKAAALLGLRLELIRDRKNPRS